MTDYRSWSEDAAIARVQLIFRLKTWSSMQQRKDQYKSIRLVGQGQPTVGHLILATCGDDSHMSFVDPESEMFIR